MRIGYIADKQLYVWEDGRVTALPSVRYQKYLAAMQSIHDAKAWKTTGTGAMFTGAAADAPVDPAKIPVGLHGLAPDPDGMLYAVELDQVGGLYRRDLDPAASEEGHVMTRQNMFFGGIHRRGDQLAMCTGSSPQLLHLSILDLRDNSETEITDGDTRECDPCWSPDGSRILFSSAGYARSDSGKPAMLGPHEVLAYAPGSGSLDTLCSNPAFDYLSPQESSEAALYCIRQPYDNGQKRSSLLKDILLFPVRIIKALGGLLNYFSIRYGGEPLRSDSSSPERTKKKSPQELFFEGNLIKAEENLKQNQLAGDKYPGICPRNRVLLRIDPDGKETTLRHSVLDYTLLPDGRILCSNGAHLLLLDGSQETELAKVKLAHDLTLLEV